MMSESKDLIENQLLLRGQCHFTFDYRRLYTPLKSVKTGKHVNDILQRTLSEYSLA